VFFGWIAWRLLQCVFFRLRLGAARALQFLAIGPAAHADRSSRLRLLRWDWIGFGSTRQLLSCSNCSVRAGPSVRPNNSFKPTPLRGFLASCNGTL